jgi:enoyl-ACP reductase-like protein
VYSAIAADCSVPVSSTARCGRTAPGALQLEENHPRVPAAARAVGDVHPCRVVARQRHLIADLTGRTALVTGGTRGLGAATVRALAARGAAVAFSYVRSGAAAESLSREDEVAAAVTFLAGPDAAYITGASLDVDGGYNA